METDGVTVGEAAVDGERFEEADKDSTPPGWVLWRGFCAQADSKIEQLTVRKTYRPKKVYSIPPFDRR